MPNLIEIEGLLQGHLSRNLRNLGKTGRKSKSKSGKKSRKTVTPKVTKKRVSKKVTKSEVQRKIALAERFFAEGKKGLALMWAAQAEKAAAKVRSLSVKRRAQDIIKAVRGQQALKSLSSIGDIDGIVQGRLLGLW